jgi:pimeloyl-ACP methyl ester carboxylesterase
MTDEASLILVPGLLCTAELFGPQVAAFSKSHAIQVADHTGASSLADIAASILAQAPRRFALAGLSMGGYVAFEILKQAPERVSRLALLDTNARADRPEQAQQRRDLVASARKDGLAAAADKLLPLLVHPARLSDAPLTSLVRRMAEDTGVEVFARQQEAIIARPDNRPFLASIRCPTLIIVGAEDAITPVKVAEEMRAGIAGSRLEVIPECGHLSTLERPETVNRLLADWLAA